MRCMTLGANLGTRGVGPGRHAPGVPRNVAGYDFFVFARRWGVGVTLLDWRTDCAVRMCWLLCCVALCRPCVMFFADGGGLYSNRVDTARRRHSRSWLDTAVRTPAQHAGDRARRRPGTVHPSPDRAASPSEPRHDRYQTRCSMEEAHAPPTERRPRGPQGGLRAHRTAADHNRNPITRRERVDKLCDSRLVSMAPAPICILLCARSGSSRLVLVPPTRGTSMSIHTGRPT